MKSPTRIRFILHVGKDGMKVHDLWHREQKCYVEKMVDFVMLEFDKEQELAGWLRRNVKHVHTCKHCIGDSIYTLKDYKEELAKHRAYGRQSGR